MTVPPISEIILPTKPSRQLVNAAYTAATSPHALVNLIRLVKSLDKTDPDISEGDFAGEVALRRDWETCRYARVFLSFVRAQNEQSSSTAGTLASLDKTLRDIEKRFASITLPHPAIPNGFTNPAHIPLPMSPSSSSPKPTFSPLVVSEPPESRLQPSLPSEPSISTPIPSTSTRRRRTPTDYLHTRLRDDEEGGEAGLLPLRVAPVKEADARERLLGSGGSTDGVGSSQLHEELGGQLVDMSHRLKLNAIHFASSLNEEKALLDTSTLTLENNLASTRSSKKDLSAVARKGRGTTCLTLGVVVFVIVVFVWTYLLIRFT